MDLQLINVSYVEVADDDIERQVEEGLRKVEEHLKTLPRSTSSSMPQVCSMSIAQNALMSRAGCPAYPQDIRQPDLVSLLSSMEAMLSPSCRTPRL